MAKTLRTLFEITYREDIDKVITELNPIEWAYIKHDNDKLINGEAKKTHYHIWCRWENPQRNGTIQKILGLNDKHNCETARSQKACIRYMTHETKDAIKLGKFRYERENIITNLEKDEIARIFLLTENDNDKINSIIELLGRYKREVKLFDSVIHNDSYIDEEGNFYDLKESRFKLSFDAFILDVLRCGYLDVYNKYYNSIFRRMIKNIWED